MGPLTLSSYCKPQNNPPVRLVGPMALLPMLIVILFQAGSPSAASGLPVQHSDVLDYPYADDSYRADWSKDWAMLSGRLNQPKCIDIPANLSLCSNIGYTQMRLPNLLDHDSVTEVVQQASSWMPLLGIRCHPDTKLFLCSLFSPVCLDRPIWPCRSLCEAVRVGCIGYMSNYGFPWPDMLRCDKFPLDNDLCIGLQTEQKEDDTVCKPCKIPETLESIVHHYCVADFAMKVQLMENVIVSDSMKLVPQGRRKMIKKGILRKREWRRMELFVANGRNCDCPTVANITEESTQFFLVMGKLTGTRAEVTYISPYSRTRTFRSAMRKIRQPRICHGGLNAITGGGGGAAGAHTTSVPSSSTQYVTSTGNNLNGRRNRNRGGRRRDRGGRNRNRKERNERRRGERRNRRERNMRA